MKRISLLSNIMLCISGFFCTTVQGQWIQQGLGYEVSQIYTPQLIVCNQNVVWGYGMNSGYLQNFSRTLDGGANWQLGYIPGYANTTILYMTAIDENKAWAILTLPDPINNNLLVKTSDGGLSWQQLNSNFFPKTYMYKIHFWDENKGFAVCNNDSLHIIRFYTTEDGGNSWAYQDSSFLLNQYQTIETIEGFRYMPIQDSNIKLISLWGRLFTSHDWGKHWSVNWTPYTSQNIFSNFKIDFQTNMLHGLLWGNWDQIYETFNGGTSWTQFITSGIMGYYQIKWIPGTANTCLRISTNQTDDCSYSIDGGHTWTEFPEMFGKQLMATGWYDNHTGWVSEITKDPQPPLTGIFKFDSTFVNIPWLEPKKEYLTLSPNPCSDILNVRVSGYDANYGTFILTSGNGQEVLKKEVSLSLSEQEFIINVRNLSPGLYMARFYTPTQIFSKKIVIMSQ